MRTHDTSHHTKHVNEDVVGSQKNGSTSSVDDGQMETPQVHPHSSQYMPSTIDHEREDFDEEHLHGAPC